jgi:hypothetical protein
MAYLERDRERDRERQRETEGSARDRERQRGEGTKVIKKPLCQDSGGTLVKPFVEPLASFTLLSLIISPIIVPIIPSPSFILS